MTITVVNMIPKALSGETNQDSEPNLAVNPNNPLQMVATAFTPNPSGGSNAPIYISSDGGKTWSLNAIVPGATATFPTADITMKFGGTSNVLYGGILRADNLDLNILRTDDYANSASMTILETRASEDQPWVQATTAGGPDRVYVGNNDFNTSPKTATIDQSFNATSSIPPVFVNLDASDSNWRTSWDLIVAGDFIGNGKAQVLLYDRGAGQADVVGYDANGNFNLDTTNSGWRTSWDIIVAGDFIGNGKDQILLYDRAGGTGDVVGFDATGKANLDTSNNGWRTSWDLIVVGDFIGNGKDQILLYDRAGGTGDVVGFDANGKTNLDTSNNGWRTSWDLIVGGNFIGNGKDQILLYDHAGGTGDVVGFDANGKSNLDTSNTGWRTSWNLIVGGNFIGNGKDQILLYDRAGGTGDVVGFDANGKSNLDASNTGWRTSWNPIVAGDLIGNNKDQILLYDRAFGQADVVGFDASGNSNMDTTSFGWRTSWDLIVTDAFIGNGRQQVLLYDRTAGQADVVGFLSTNNLFSPTTIASRSPGAGQNGPSIRPVIHSSGWVYAAYFNWKSSSASSLLTVDVVVCRDNTWGVGSNPYTALTDPGDHLAGVRVASVTIPWENNHFLGQERVGSHLSIAVDPNNQNSVFLAWADFPNGVAPYTIHLRHSTDGGQTWSADLRAIANGINPALAINNEGYVGFLYQTLTGGNTWETHIEISSNAFATAPTPIVLAKVPSNTPTATFLPYLGDYIYLTAAGNNFYGVFCANNTPNNANFPHGVTYQRNANFTTQQLLNVNNTTPVAVSIDPFFFEINESIFPIIPIAPVAPIIVVKPVEPVAPVKPVHPIAPVLPVEPIKPQQAK